MMMCPSGVFLSFVPIVAIAASGPRKKKSPSFFVLLTQNTNPPQTPTNPQRKNSFYDREAPIYTMSRFLPPSKIVDAEIHNCIIGDGSLIKAGSTVSHSVVGLRSLINEDCTIADAMLMGSDYYETLDECEFVPGCLPMGVGAVRVFFCARASR